MKRTPLVRRRLYRPPPRTDPVDPMLRIRVLQRDNGCVALRLDPGAGPCAGRLTLDHVRDEAMLGRRAPSDERHLVTLCELHHTGLVAGSNWATSHRPELRVYLASVDE